MTGTKPPSNRTPKRYLTASPPDSCLDYLVHYLYELLVAEESLKNAMDAIRDRHGDDAVRHAG